MILRNRIKCFKFSIISIVVIFIFLFYMRLSIRLYKKQNIDKLCTDIKTIETRLNTKFKTFEGTFQRVKAANARFQQWRRMSKEHEVTKNFPMDVDLTMYQDYVQFYTFWKYYLKIKAKLRGFKLELGMYTAEKGYCDSMLDRLYNTNMFDIWYFTVPDLEWYDRDVELQFDRMMVEWENMQMERILNNYFRLVKYVLPPLIRKANENSAKPV